MTTRPLDLFYYLIFLVLAVLSCIINRVICLSVSDGHVSSWMRYLSRGYVSTFDP